MCVESGNSNDAPQYMLCIIIFTWIPPHVQLLLYSIYKYIKNLKNINLK